MISVSCGVPLKPLRHAVQGRSTCRAKTDHEEHDQPSAGFRLEQKLWKIWLDALEKIQNPRRFMYPPNSRCLANSLSIVVMIRGVLPTTGLGFGPGMEYMPIRPGV